MAHHARVYQECMGALGGWLVKGESRGGARPWRRVWRVEVIGGRLTLPADLPIAALDGALAGPRLVRMHALEPVDDREGAPTVCVRVWRLVRRAASTGATGRPVRLRRIAMVAMERALTELEGVDILPAG
jgi:hypothetical protein